MTEDSTLARLEKGLAKLINLSRLKRELETLEGKDLVDAYTRILPFILARKQAVSQDITASVRDEAQRMIDGMLRPEEIPLPPGYTEGDAGFDGDLPDAAEEPEDERED